VARMGERSGAYGDLVRKPEGKRPLGNPSVHERIILKLIFKKQDGVDCIDLAQDGDTWKAVVNTVIKIRVPQNMETF